MTNDITSPARLRGNGAIEDAAIDWVMHLERLAGREPVDRRHDAPFPADIWSPPYTIEVKAAGGSIRGSDLWLEAAQVQAAEADSFFVLDVIDNVAQGDPRHFGHRRFAGGELSRLLTRKKRRTYHEVPLPVADLDAAPSHESLLGGPVAMPDRRPAWVIALGATRVSVTKLATSGGVVGIVTARVEYQRASGPKGPWTETYGKTPIVGQAGPDSCAEVEIVAALRGQGWDASWIDSFGSAPARWLPYMIKPASLPGDVLGTFQAIDAATVRTGRTTGGAWDIVAWRDGVMWFLESKGAGDSIRPSQIAWLESAVRHGIPPAQFGIVNYVVKP